MYFKCTTLTEGTKIYQVWKEVIINLAANPFTVCSLIFGFINLFYLFICLFVLYFLLLLVCVCILYFSGYKSHFSSFLAVRPINSNCYCKCYSTLSQK